MPDSVPPSPSNPKNRRIAWVKILLITLPIWMLISGGIGLWMYFKNEEQQANAEADRFTKLIEIPSLADDLEKFVVQIGERHTGSETAAANLSRALSMTEGSVGPSNIGYKVHRIRSGSEWPMLHITRLGTDPAAPALWVLAAMDSPVGTRGAERNASGLVATLAAAGELANEDLKHTVHFLFLPHANGPLAPIDEEIKRLIPIIGPKPLTVLYVEAMGAANPLLLSTESIDALALRKMEGIAKPLPLEEVDEANLTFIQRLQRAGLPMVRVATRNPLGLERSDDDVPSAAHTAAAAGRLVELIKRLSNS